MTSPTGRNRSRPNTQDLPGTGEFMKPIKMFEAIFEYQATEQISQGVASHTSISYMAANNVSAIRDALRWWDNRHEAIPQYFTRMCALKVYAVTPHVVDHTGYLPTATGFPFYEWKRGLGSTPLASLDAFAATTSSKEA